ncbi:MAG: hypothetical protein SPI77_03795 [Corynebacterium sp.]|nr:hypothetical protein [Corynebacterium sp.]
MASLSPATLVATIAGALAALIGVIALIAGLAIGLAPSTVGGEPTSSVDPWWNMEEPDTTGARARIVAVPTQATLVSADRFDAIATGTYHGGSDTITFGPRFGEPDFTGPTADLFTPGVEPATLRKFSHTFDCNLNSSLLWLDGDYVRIGATISTKMGCSLNLEEVALRNTVFGPNVQLFTLGETLYMGTREAAVELTR